MKKLSLLFFYFTLFFVFACTDSNADNKLQEFAQDLSSANVKLRGELMLFGEYKGNLKPLTYESYIVLLKKSEMESNKGLSAIISDSPKKYFESRSNTFIIVLYSKKMNAIIYDDANTAFIDKIIKLNKNEDVPDLKSFVN